MRRPTTRNIVVGGVVGDMGTYGVYGESAVVPAYAVAHYPGSLSPVEGAAIWMQYLTAFGALIEFGHMKKDAIRVDHRGKQQRGAGRDPDHKIRRGARHRHHSRRRKEILSHGRGGGLRHSDR